MTKKKGKKNRKQNNTKNGLKLVTEGNIRSPIFAILGHVDSGKTSLLDKVRKTSVQAREAAGITQHIGASFFPVETIEAISGQLMNKMNIKKLEIPGILFIDTPGHASFFNLRQRGASAANLAVLVVDVKRGIQPQTIESIRILRRNKVPFIIAANKIDRIPGWKSNLNIPMDISLEKQSPGVIKTLDNLIYDIMGELSRHGKIMADRFDKIKAKELTAKIVIIPTSAKTGEGIPELFLYLTGLSQRFLKEKLRLSPDEPGTGSILEVKEETGLGKTLDVLLLNGFLRKNDSVLLGGINGPIETKIRSLLLPKPLDEIRDPRDKFTPVDRIVAAAGVKISAPDLDEAIPGAPIYAYFTSEQRDKFKKDIETELSKIQIETDEEGIILKTDTLGSLEALVGFLQDNNIRIRFANVGSITKRDIIEASLIKQQNENLGVILSFNASILPDAKELAEKEKIPVFTNDVIYRLLEDYQNWLVELTDKERLKLLDGLARPAKIRLLPYIFRQNNPAVVGVEVLGGILQTKRRLIDSTNNRIGQILQIQDKGENIQIAKMGNQIALSIQGPTVGRQIDVGDEFYVDLTEKEAIGLQSPEIKGLISSSEINILNDLIDIKRKYTGQRFWGLP
ncbi:MAG: translation initiation factor IF-2 [Candidatus Hodarchaeales archaeon]